MARNERTSKSIASTASKLLSNPSTPKATHAVSGALKRAPEGYWSG